MAGDCLYCSKVVSEDTGGWECDKCGQHVHHTCSMEHNLYDVSRGMVLTKYYRTCPGCNSEIRIPDHPDDLF